MTKRAWISAACLLGAVFILGPSVGKAQNPPPEDHPAVTVKGQTYTPRSILARNMGTPEDQTTPFPPHRVVGNIYYVGTKTLSSFLIVTPAGHILINTGLGDSVKQIRAGVEKLGFRFGDIKILLAMQSHYDHMAGMGEIVRLTGAKVYATEADAPIMEDGGRSDPSLGKAGWFPPVKVDRRLEDGDVIELGGQELTAVHTPGHTRGCTTWTFDSSDGMDAVLVCSSSILDYRFVGKESYPGIAADFEKSFAKLRKLPCDLFLAPHGGFFDLGRKLEKAKVRDGSPNPFVDPDGFRAYVDLQEKNFRARLAEQQ